jgi:RNA polymerase sigma-70 factor, ECF subfamily
VEDDEGLTAALRRGEPDAFATLVDRHSGAMIRVAMAYVPSRETAEEVVQEAWIGVIRGIESFEGRSSLKTWILRIVVNTAMTRGAREARSVPFSALAPEGEEPAVEPGRFRGPEDAFPGHWQAYPADWSALPEERLLGRETLDVIARAIDELPLAQRTVITMRDVQGCPAEEVCEALEVSDANQRVLLHRARARVRAALEGHFDD